MTQDEKIAEEVVCKMVGSDVLIGKYEYKWKDAIAEAIQKARAEERNKVCDQFIETTKNDTNKDVAGFCYRVAQAIRNLK